MMEKTNPRRVNPPQQLAAYEASRPSPVPDEPDRVDHEWTNDEVWEMILDGCDEPGDHADPSGFEPGDLLDMWRTCENLCPLHLVPEYPKVPSGVWSREAWAADRRLKELTRTHTSRESIDLGQHLGDDEVCGHEFHVTADEWRQVRDAFPHARWRIEQLAEQGMIDVRVIAS